MNLIQFDSNYNISLRKSVPRGLTCEIVKGDTMQTISRRR